MYMTRSAMTGALAAAGVLLVSGALGSAGAQTVRGTLVQDPGGATLGGRPVVLLDETGTAVDSAVSAPDGTFTLRAPGGGAYVLYFSSPGYASVPSSPLRLVEGETVEHRFEVPLIAGAALQRMSEVLDVEERLRTDVVELCGERPRSWEAGILVGVARRHPGGEPLAGAVVRVEAPGPDGGEPFRKTTVTSANGVYVLCNVPPGTVTTTTRLAGYRTDEGPVEVHAGTVGWYDVYLRPW